MNHETSELHDFALSAQQDWTQSYITSAATLLLFTILYAIVNAWLSDSTPLASKLRQFVSLPLTMWRRLPNSQVAIGVGSPMHKVFGLDSSSLLRPPTISSPTRSLASLLRKGDSDAPPGLGNWDNSCYQNSIIQGLSSLPSLPLFLQNVETRGSRKGDGSTSGALLAIFSELYSKENAGRHLWLPRALKSMSTWQQQDAQEYFSKILDQVDKEASFAAKASNSSSNVLGFALDPDEVEGKRDDSANSSPESPTGDFSQQRLALRNPLEGLLAQRVSCTRCGHTDGLSLIPFNCLTVQLGNAYACDIRQCLGEYTKLEFIPDVQCPKCTLLHQRRRLKSFQSHSSTLPDNLKVQVAQRLEKVAEALRNEDFGDATVVKECGVKKEHWTLSTKTRQAVIARAPRSLIIHVNRSCFNEFTGAQTKNYADVEFPLDLDLGRWCVGGEITRASEGDEEAENNGRTKKEDLKGEKVDMDKGDIEEKMEGWHNSLGLAAKSMLLAPSERSTEMYGLRAVVTHHGRHENGHYICYRQHPTKGSLASSLVSATPKKEEDDVISLDGIEEGKGREARSSSEGRKEKWWQLSDESVRAVSEEMVLGQGEVFMLFYEKIDCDSVSLSMETADALGESEVKELSREMVTGMDIDVDGDIPITAQGALAAQDEMDHFENAEGARPVPFAPLTTDMAAPAQALEGSTDAPSPSSDANADISSSETIDQSQHPERSTLARSVEPSGDLNMAEPQAPLSKSHSTADPVEELQSNKQDTIENDSASGNDYETETETEKTSPLRETITLQKAPQPQPLIMRTSSMSVTNTGRREEGHLEGMRVVEAS